MKIKKFAFGACLGLMLVSTLAAQETSRFTFDVGAGFTNPVGPTGRELDGGWNVRGGAGFNFSSYVGALVQADYNAFGINGTTLNNVGFPDGDLHIFSATLNPIIHFHPHGRIDPYIIGGGGVYHRMQEFTQPSVSTFTGFDPFFGFYTALVPTTQVLASYSVTKPGFNVGAGIGLGSKWHGKFFAEARYHRIFMGNDLHTDYLPVTFGYRW